MKSNWFLGILLFCSSCFSGDVLWSQRNAKKTTVAVLEFQSGGTLEKTDAFTLTNRFRALLVKTQAFQVIERDKMNTILKEQDFIVSDNCNSAECVIQVGQLLGVEVMIAGDLGKLGETYTIDLRMIDVQTGVVVQSQSRNHKGQIDGLLDVMQLMVNELAEAATGRSIVAKYLLTIAADLPFHDSSHKIDIIVNGTNIGQNRVQILLPAGIHSIYVTANDSNFTEYRKDIDFKGDQKIDIKLEYSEYYHKHRAAKKEQTEKELASKQRIVITKDQQTGKTTGGPSNALLSVLFPGLGGYFVEENKIRPAIASVSTVGLIGFGLIKKNQSNLYYSDYKKATNLNDARSLYKKANNAHHAYYIATRIGVAFWVADIIWVAYQGMQNQKQDKTVSGHGLTVNICNNQLQVGYVIDLSNF